MTDASSSEYVGLHRRCIPSRVGQHVSGIRYGKHLIFKKDRLAQLPDWQDHLDTRAAETDETLAYAFDREVDGLLHDREKKQLPSDVQFNIQPHVDFYIDNLYVTCAHVDPAGHPDEQQRNGVVDWLEQAVKAAIGPTRVRGKVGANLLTTGPNSYDIVAPRSLSYAFRGERSGVRYTDVGEVK